MLKLTSLPIDLFSGCLGGLEHVLGGGLGVVHSGLVHILILCGDVMHLRAPASPQSGCI